MVLYSQHQIKEMIQTEVQKEIQNLMDSLDAMRNIGGGYLNNFRILFDTFKDLKEAYESLKKGYVEPNIL
jgi:hypothetical protein